MVNLPLRDPKTLTTRRCHQTRPRNYITMSHFWNSSPTSAPLTLVLRKRDWTNTFQFLALSLSLSVSLLLSSLGCHSTCARIGGSLVLGDQLSGDAAPVDHLDLAHGLQHLSVRTAELLDVGRQKSHPLRLGHFDPVANVEGPTVRPHTSDREQSGNPKLSSQFCA